MSNLALPGERVDDLQAAGLRILQKPDGFRFGTDSVLLAHFASAKDGDRVVDLGAGTGAVSLLMAARYPNTRFEMVEIQDAMANMAARSVRLNGLEARIAVHTLDMRDAPDRLGRAAFDVAVLNPPYGRAGATCENGNEALRVARHEVHGCFSDYAHAMGALLRNGGCAYVVHLAGRMLDVLDALRDAHLQPKRICLVHQTAQSAPTHLLVMARKCVRPGFTWLPPVIVSCDGQRTEQMQSIYAGHMQI